MLLRRVVWAEEDVVREMRALYSVNYHSSYLHRHERLFCRYQPANQPAKKQRWQLVALDSRQMSARKLVVRWMAEYGRKVVRGFVVFICCTRSHMAGDQWVCVCEVQEDGVSILCIILKE